MKSILEELWYGNICPETDSRTTTPEMKQLMEYMARHHETLLATLNDEQKETFEKFDGCWSEYTIRNYLLHKLYQIFVNFSRPSSKTSTKRYLCKQSTNFTRKGLPNDSKHDII